MFIDAMPYVLSADVKKMVFSTNIFVNYTFDIVVRWMAIQIV